MPVHRRLALEKVLSFELEAEEIEIAIRIERRRKVRKYRKLFGNQESGNGMVLFRLFS